jgi:hypothetical protein
MKLHLGALFGQMDINNDKENQTLYHRTSYNFKSLKKLLDDNCYMNVQKYEWQYTIHKDYHDHSQAYFPHMDKENGILVSLNFEATKV